MSLFDMQYNKKIKEITNNIKTNMPKRSKLSLNYIRSRIKVGKCQLKTKLQW